MSDYNVDDILAEIEKEKSAAKPAAAPVPPKDAPKQAAHTDAPPKSTEEQQLEARRQARVESFMQNSFAAREGEPDEFDDDGIDLSEVFGRVRSHGLRHEGAETKTEAETADEPKSTKHAGHTHKAKQQAEKPEKPEKPAEEEKKPRRGFMFINRADDDTDDDDGDEDTFDFEFSEPKEKRPLFPKREKKEKPAREKPAREESDEPAPAQEYRSPADAAEIRDELAASHKRLFIRMIITGVCFVLDLYLSLCNLYPLPLLTQLCPENNMRLYILTCLVPLIVSVAAAFPVLVNGLPALFARRAGHDTPAALCVLCVLIHTAALLGTASLELSSGAIYTCVACAALFANTLGKRTMVSRIERNFAVISSASSLCAEQLLCRDALAAQITGIPAEEEPQIVYSTPVTFGEKFLEYSYSADDSDRMCRILSPILPVFGIIVGILCKLVFKQSAVDALGVVCLMLCMASALSETLVGNLPLWRAALTLTREGGFVAGAASVEVLGDTDAVSVNANEIYPAGSAMLHGIKALRRDRIDEAILNAASILDAVGGIARDAFLETVGGKRGILRPVCDWKYENGGVFAQVDGHEVLLGDRSLLIAHGVRVPSEEAEGKYTRHGREALYIAQDGEPFVLCVLSYRVSKYVEFWLRRLSRRGIGLIVRTAEPAITPARIERDYGYPAGLVRIISPQLDKDWQALTKPRDTAPAYAVSISGSRVRLRLLCALSTLQNAVRLGTFIQSVGLLLGYALVALLAFFGSESTLGFAQVLAYQAFWCAAALGIPAFMRF